jgi:CTP:molybdopterin cytidylyltransferase MocA
VGTAGLLLAAGGGRRMGRAKALVPVPGGSGTLLERGLRVLRDAGCAPVVVVLGASADLARPLAGAADLVVEAADWADGQSASLRVGLTALQDTDADAACVLLVDLPDVGADAVARVRGAAGEDPGALARAAYEGTPGHPVVMGRAHWAGALATLHGDEGARGYLATHPHLVVECGDLATGQDVDTPADLG